MTKMICNWSLLYTWSNFRAVLILLLYLAQLVEFIYRKVPELWKSFKLTYQLYDNLLYLLLIVKSYYVLPLYGMNLYFFDFDRLNEKQGPSATLKSKDQSSSLKWSRLVNPEPHHNWTLSITLSFSISNKLFVKSSILKFESFFKQFLTANVNVNSSPLQFFKKELYFENQKWQILICGNLIPFSLSPKLKLMSVDKGSLQYLFSMSLL